MLSLRHIIKLILFVSLVITIVNTPVFSNDNQEISIGVLAHRGVEKTNLMWKPTARYLENQIKGYQFKIIPLSIKQMDKAVQQNELDFILTNTGHYVNLEATYGVTRMATLKNMRQGNPYTSFGAVIFVRSDRNDINRLTDLKNKSFAAVSRNAFGGFQMAWRELMHAGIDPFNDFSELKFSGFPQDQIVKEVLDGKIDAGTVRTDTLERMVKSGDINPDDFRILNSKQTPEFPFLHSTVLYPEWPFSRAKNTDIDFSTQVVIALLSLSSDSPASRAGFNSGWTVPLNYQRVHEIFKELKVGPYAQSEEITLTQIINQYRYWLIIIVTGLLFAAYHFIQVERLVKVRTKKLEIANLKQKKYLDIVDNHVISSSTDKHGVITDVSKAFCKISQYSPDELIGRSHNIIRHPDTPSTLYKNMWNNLNSGTPWTGTIKNKTKNGSHYWVETHIEPVFNDNGKIKGYTAIRKDITDKKRIEEISVTDPLTCLFNRLKLDQKLIEEYHYSKRYQHPLSIIMFDIDHFKEINDSYGHQMGDTVLKEIASLFQKAIRKTDSFGRWGGDEFLIICPETPNRGTLELAESLKIKSEQKRFKKTIKATCSFGVSTLRSEETIEDLLSRVDKALYQAKRMGRNQVVSDEFIEKVLNQI